MELAIAFMTGVVLLMIGLSCFLRMEDWSAWLNELKLGERHRVLPIASFEVLFSALMVGLHPVWSGPFVIVTVIWALGILEGSIYLLCPSVFKKVLMWFTPYHAMALRGFGLVFVVLGAFILYTLWSM